MFIRGACFTALCLSTALQEDPYITSLWFHQARIPELLLKEEKTVKRERGLNVFWGWRKCSQHAFLHHKMKAQSFSYKGLEPYIKLQRSMDTLRKLRHCKVRSLRSLGDSGASLGLDQNPVSASVPCLIALGFSFNADTWFWSCWSIGSNIYSLFHESCRYVICL